MRDIDISNIVTNWYCSDVRLDTCAQYLREHFRRARSLPVRQGSAPVALEQLGALKKEHAELETELAAYGACDPAKIEEKRAVVLAKEAAVRWTGECL